MIRDVLVPLISALIGAIAAIVVARVQGPRRQSASEIAVATQGKVISSLGRELERLDSEVAEARADADGARKEARAARDAEQRLLRRVNRLEAALHSAGIDPATINGE
jgi:hypothetical protein